MFVTRRGVWFGSDAERMFNVLLGESQKTCNFGEDDCHSTLHSFTTMAGHYGYLRRPASSCFYEQKNYYVFLCNLSCYCKRNFPDLVGLFGDNKSA